MTQPYIGQKQPPAFIIAVVPSKNASDINIRRPHMASKFGTCRTIMAEMVASALHSQRERIITRKSIDKSLRTYYLEMEVMEGQRTGMHLAQANALM